MIFVFYNLANSLLDGYTGDEEVFLWYLHILNCFIFTYFFKYQLKVEDLFINSPIF